jgi:ADP-ribose pyrophosphatase
MEIDSTKFVSAKMTDGKYLNQFEISYRNNLGKECEWALSSRADTPKCITGQFDVPDAVIIVPYHWSSDRLIVTREYRVALADYEWGFPAGLVDKNESIEVTAKRELFEETGLELTKITKISPPIYSSPGMTDESVSIVYGECKGRPTSKHNENSECIETLFLSLAEVRYILKKEQIKFGAKAWLILDNFVQRGHF